MPYAYLLIWPFCKMCTCLSNLFITFSVRATVICLLVCKATGNKFVKHVFNCQRQHNHNHEPFFKLYAFTTVKDESSLLPYKSNLHQLELDTMN